jgi:hypothetical protein
MRFQVGDCVIAKYGAKMQAGIVFKTTCVESEENPGRHVFSVRFPDSPQNTSIFVYAEPMHCGADPDGYLWSLPDGGPFEPYVEKIVRSGQTIWPREE